MSLGYSVALNMHQRKERSGRAKEYTIERGGGGSHLTLHELIKTEEMKLTCPFTQKLIIATNRLKLEVRPSGGRKGVWVASNYNNGIRRDNKLSDSIF